MVNDLDADAWMFRLTCRQARQVYLMVEYPTGKSRLLPLDQTSPTIWQRSVPLEPGVYRFCYYVDDGCTTTFHLPPDAELDGLKAVLRTDASIIDASLQTLRA